MSVLLLRLVVSTVPSATSRFPRCFLGTEKRQAKLPRNSVQQQSSRHIFWDMLRHPRGLQQSNKNPV